MFAVPVGALVFGGTWVVLRAAARRGRRVAGALLGGLVAGWLWFVLQPAWAPAAGPDPGFAPAAIVDALLLPLRAPWWSLPLLVAPWAGFALAVLAARRGSRRAS
jgi:hypothetical protein